MVCHRLKTLDDSLTNSHTRHHDDKLCPAIVLIEFVHGLDIGIGLTRSRLHLYAQCQCAIAVTKHVIDWLQLLTDLHFTNIAS